MTVSSKGSQALPNNTSGLSSLTKIQGSLSHSWNLLPGIASLPPLTPGSSWAAPGSAPGRRDTLYRSQRRQQNENHHLQQQNTALKMVLAPFSWKSSKYWLQTS